MVPRGSGTLGRRMRWLCLLFVVAVAGAGSSRPLGAQTRVPIDGIVAQVGDEIVLSSEIDEQIAILNLRKSLPDTNLAQLREQILDRIIDEKVIVQEARARGITAGNDEIEAAVQKHLSAIRDQLGGDEGFKRELAKEGLTEAELLDRYRDEARRELLYNRLIQREIYSKIEIAPAEAEKYFEDHKSELPPKPGKVELAHVFVALRPDPEVFRQAQMKLKQVEQRMDKGDSFGAIAHDLSDDPEGREKNGDIGWFDPGELDPRLADAVKSLEVGEISSPLQTSQGIELLRLAERDSSRVHLEHIRVNMPISDEGRERARKGAEEVHTLAVKGADFGLLAKEYSDDTESKEKGGNLGTFATNELTPTIGGAVKDVEVGGVSDVVGSDVGFHVFKVLSRDGGGEWTYDEVKDRVLSVMAEERAQTMTDSWLNGVRAHYFIRRTDGAPVQPASSQAPLPSSMVPAAASSTAVEGEPAETTHP
jgi:peptidyl-prolyl cis-trans isomerase SurA